MAKTGALQTVRIGVLQMAKSDALQTEENG